MAASDGDDCATDLPAAELPVPEQTSIELAPSSPVPREPLLSDLLRQELSGLCDRLEVWAVARERSRVAEQEDLEKRMARLESRFKLLTEQLDLLVTPLQRALVAPAVAPQALPPLRDNLEGDNSNVPDAALLVTRLQDSLQRLTEKLVEPTATNMSGSLLILVKAA